MVRIIEIDKRVATIEVSPEDCLALARACEESCSGFRDSAVSACESLGALFSALAMAAVSYTYLPADEDLTMTTVRGSLTPDGYEPFGG